MSASTHYPITGYVANTGVGTVHLVAEGTRGHVSALIQDILLAMHGLVAGHSIAWSEGTGEFSDFQIRRNEP